MASKTFIVTGASRASIYAIVDAKYPIHGTGIGLATAKFLLSAPQSHNVVVMARSAEPLQKLKDQYPTQVEVLTGDLADFSLGQKAVELALKAFGRLDGLVLNHGMLGQVANVAEADPQQWQHGFDVNFISLVAFIKAGLPALRESKGKIVFTSSGASVSGFKGWGLYGATKAAMNHLALSLGEEEPEVTSVSIDPGLVDTEIQRQIREDLATTMDRQFHSVFTTVHQAGNLLKPEQPGHVLAKLVIDAPKSLTGKYLTWNDESLEAFQ